ncbi:hypothetical protein [Paludisphaera mucosa]|uniref:Uncharacterized protein n=1 Tax=Paludisphaera mucosa TaxID=3030827 RepID=A0ABT6FJX1_9BACT|nr:hypothetical protein [Paludisphaera mucosa]MDG3007847.1 hypothetical protein [Paludisphaera mucosa]
MGRRGQTVWVVMHYEIMGLPAAPRVDSVQFHVSSSLEKAEEYVRGVCVDAHSWWQVHPHVVDAADLPEGAEVHFYSHRGSRLKAAPMRRAIAAFGRHAARHPESYPAPPQDEP